MTENPATEESPAPLTVLDAPADGVPAITETPEQLDEVCTRFAAAEGPVAVDAERASGFRYGQKTYLAQFKRSGAGIALIDTAILDDLSRLSAALGDAEWILHAASQDLPGLRELKMEPSRIFDTELAARLLGWPKVGLAAVVERELGVTLAKEHSAQDWSERPLPHEWLTYAALDVDVLIDLRDSIAAHLERDGKLEWAQEEFEAVRLAGPPEPKPDPWRRVSGTHKVRDPRGLAIVRELWQARDDQARRRDISPGRVLRDAAIAAAAAAKPTSLDMLMKMREFQSRGTKRRAPSWYVAIEKAMALPEKDLPARRGPTTDAPPQQRVWKEKRPEAFARLSAAKAIVAETSEKVDVPAENLLQPDAMRRLCWEYPDGTEAGVRAFLASRGARRWQLDLLAEPLSAVLESATEKSRGAATE